MKYFLFFTLSILLAGCAKTPDEEAAPTLANIKALYQSGKYQQALDSITSLRERYPQAIESRKQALVIWQDASLKIAQNEVANTDRQLQETLQQLGSATDRALRNRLAFRRDSLQARYEAMCGVVRMIHMRQKAQDKTKP